MNGASSSETDFLRTMALRYVWDHTAEKALERPERIIRRVMDLGTWDDVLALEAHLDRRRLVEVIRACPAGGLRPRSWCFWHYRLRLADIDHDPPPMPVRRFS